MSARLVTELLLKEIRSFFTELIDGTDKYRQLFSLSEQIPHDYHNRFLVELIQNANDAVPVGSEGAVRIVFDESDPRGPRIYVGNEGSPFSESNFAAISKLGRSDKDPAAAIGNKGLGFRSVLQVCMCPRIYSDHPDPERRAPGIFGGFCFEFRPDVRALVSELAHQIAIDGAEACSATLLGVRLDQPVFDEATRVEKLRSLLEADRDLVRTEVEYLSPYSLPLPLSGSDLPDVVQELQREGCVTVIELALNDHDAVESVRAAIGQLDSDYLLFTHRIHRLSVLHRRPDPEEPDVSIDCVRTQIGAGDPLCAPDGLLGIRIRASWMDGTETSRNWWLHSGTLDGPDLIHALRQLPKRWHEVTEVELSVALERRVGAPPEAGRYSIFLPTQQSTGSALWVNGPFFGNVARTHIPVDAPYNDLLLDKGISLAVEMLDRLLAAGDSEEASLAAIDLLDPRDVKGEVPKRLHDALAKRGTHLAAIPLVPMAKGRRGKGRGNRARLTQVRLIPGEELVALSTARLADVGAAIPDARVQAERPDAIDRLVLACGSTTVPTPVELAGWGEAVATTLKGERASPELWTTFYAELGRIERERPDRSQVRAALRRRRILFTEDNRLLAPDCDHPRIFAQPMQEPEADSVQAPLRRSVPEPIQPYLSFLSSDVQLYEDRPSRPWTPAGQFLRSSPGALLEGFETREIVNKVLVRIADVTEPTDESLASALGYAFELARGSRSESVQADTRWNRLQVPTRSGWLPSERAYFGPEWEGTSGPTLFAALGQDHPATERMLVPPAALAKRVGETAPPAEEWTQQWTSFLKDFARVADTPRLLELSYRPGAPASEFEPLAMEGRYHRYATNQLTNHFGVPHALWLGHINDLASSLRAPVQAPTVYYLERQAIIEGLFDVSADRATNYVSLVAGSYEQWKAALRTRVYRPGFTWMQGTTWSVLGHVLRYHAWLPAQRQGPDGLVTAMRTPESTWFIPPDVLESPQLRYRYTFLWHLPLEVARAAGEEFRTTFGLRLVSRTTSLNHGIRLLGALSEAAASSSVPAERDREFSELWRETLSQTSRFYTAPESERARALGIQYHVTGLRVLERGRSVWKSVDTASPEDPIYLPERASVDPALADQLVLADLRREQAERQAELLRALFGDLVAPVSELSVTPVAEGTDLGEALAASQTLGEVAPWVVRFVLAVFGFGRGQEMNLRGDEFRSAHRRLTEVRIVEVPALELHVEGREILLDTPIAYVWANRGALLVDVRHLGTLADLTQAFQTLLGVADLEHPLYRAFASLEVSSLHDPEPLMDRQMAALRPLHVTSLHTDRLSVALGDQAEMRILEMVIPAVCAIRHVTDEAIAAAVARSLRFAAGERTLLTAAAEALGASTSPTAPELMSLAHHAASLALLAEQLGCQCGVSLGAWNDAVSALGPPYTPLQNPDLDEDFSRFLDDYAPILSAVLREAVRVLDRPELYLQLKEQYRGIEPDESWQDRYWDLPWTVGAGYVANWLRGHIVMPAVLEAVLSAPTQEQARGDAEALGLDLQHDDEGIETQNRSMLDRLRDDRTIELVVWWQRTHPTGTALPNTLANFGGPEFYSPEVRSTCQLSILSEADATALIAQRATAQGLFQALGVPAGAFPRAQDATPDERAAAKRRLDNAQEEEERRRNVRVVLGAEYAVPSGEVFEGLGRHIDAVLPADFAQGVSLEALHPLGSLPTESQSRKKPKIRNPRPFSPKDAALVGAVGEYLIYRVLSRQIGEPAARAAWKSANRRHFGFPNLGNDSEGFDFAFHLEGREWMLEVKSSKGEAPFVDLTQNERKVAQRAARPNSGARYDVLYVVDALTNPRIINLGNPFTREGKRRMRVDEGGVRLIFGLPARHNKA